MAMKLSDEYGRQRKIGARENRLYDETGKVKHKERAIQANATARAIYQEIKKPDFSNKTNNTNVSITSNKTKNSKSFSDNSSKNSFRKK